MSRKRRMNSIFIMPKMPWESEYIVRLVLAGIDDGSAICLESKLDVPNIEAAEAMLDKIHKELSNVRKENHND